MTNREIVESSLRYIKNIDGGIDIDSIFSAVNAGNEQNPILTRKQIRDTLSGIKSLVRVEQGIYRLKGRYAQGT
jgi:hypothetical protein